MGERLARHVWGADGMAASSVPGAACTRTRSGGTGICCFATGREGAARCAMVETNLASSAALADVTPWKYKRSFRIAAASVATASLESVTAPAGPPRGSDTRSSRL